MLSGHALRVIPGSLALLVYLQKQLIVSLIILQALISAFGRHHVLKQLELRRKHLRVYFLFQVFDIQLCEFGVQFRVYAPAPGIIQLRLYFEITFFEHLCCVVRGNVFFVVSLSHLELVEPVTVVHLLPFHFN